MQRRSTTQQELKTHTRMVTGQNERPHHVYTYNEQKVMNLPT